MKKWYKRKTTWTGITGVFSAIGGIVTGVMNPVEAMQLIITSCSAIFIRSAIENS